MLFLDGVLDHARRARRVVAVDLDQLLTVILDPLGSLRLTVRDYDAP
jgi:hypothetical protein